ncbi:uncharacterized protein OCT59_016467 [Rhizophagus irregularis]|uniref:uncharacterized protein n=1 Tax=Rhizophagus irregularis TaxID=588596 RepID=UPI0033230DFC|nr:hypothetical protein OCT59_016467 [Rhizophagus irregularis]
MAPDFTLKIKEAETEFRAPISKLKEAERQTGLPYQRPMAFRSFISKVQDAEGPGCRRTLILKVSSSPELFWTEFRSFLVPAWTEFSTWSSSFEKNFEGFLFSSSWTKEFQRFWLHLKELRRSRLSFERTLKVLDFHLKELRRSWDFMSNISKVITSKFVTNISDFLFCFLFVGIEPTGTMFQTINNM